MPICNYGCTFSDNSQAQSCAGGGDVGVYCGLQKKMMQKASPCPFPSQEVTKDELRERCVYGGPDERIELKIVLSNGTACLGKDENGELYIYIHSYGIRSIEEEEGLCFALEENGKTKIYKVVE